MLGEYKSAYNCYNTYIEVAKLSLDNIHIIKGREGMGISLFLEDHSNLFTTTEKTNLINIKELKFNTDIEAHFESSGVAYKKIKLVEFTIEAYFKLAFYYNLFEGKSRQFLDTMKRLYDEIECLASFYKIKCLFRIKNLYDSMKMKRKSIFFLYMAMGICFENEELINMLPFLFKEINSNLFVYDIYNDKIENPEAFNIIHKKLCKSYWKKISFNSVNLNEEKKEMVETSKKRVDKESKLYVLNRTEMIKKYTLYSQWEPIQYNLFLNLLNFYKNNNDLKM